MKDRAEMVNNVLDMINQEVDNRGVVICPHCDAPIAYIKPVAMFECKSCGLSWVKVDTNIK